MRSISRQQIVRRLQAENVWWEKPNLILPPFSDWKPRAYSRLFQPLVENRSIRRAVVLMGPRRVGKTVMLHHTIQNLIDKGVKPKNICYFSVDHPIYNGLGLEDLLEIYGEAAKIKYNKEPCYVFFDEIQYLKDWEIHLKILVDRFFSLKCVVSGSAAAALRLKSQESGAGRFTTFLLPPLTFYEYLDFLGKANLEVPDKDDPMTSNYIFPDIDDLNKDFIDYINFGGYPEAAFSKEIQADPARFIKSDIVDKVLLRDLPSLYGIQDVQELNSLFTAIAYNTASQVSLDGLSKNSGVSKNTIKRYIEYLESAFLIRVVHRVDQNARRFKRANFFKVYLTNPSIWCALFSQVRHGDEVLGRLAETAVFSQWFHSDKNLYYARWKTGEVDIIALNEQFKPSLVTEVKFTDRVLDHPEMLKNVLKFCHKNNLNKARVTTLSKQDERIIENVAVTFMPTSFYCLHVGLFIIHGKEHPEIQNILNKLILHS